MRFGVLATLLALAAASLRDELDPYELDDLDGFHNDDFPHLHAAMAQFLAAKGNELLHQRRRLHAQQRRCPGDGVTRVNEAGYYVYYNAFVATDPSTWHVLARDANLECNTTHRCEEGTECYYYETNRGICSPCQLGKYCPVGTVNRQCTNVTDSDLAAGRVSSSNVVTVNGQQQVCLGVALDNLCEEGHICPNLTAQVLTSEGQFSGAGYPTGINCSVAGTYCPVGSNATYLETPQRFLCPKGSYCPSPRERLTCPSGSYCKAGFVSPRKCWWLTSCPEGSTEPGVQILGVVGGLIAIVFALVLMVTRDAKTRVHTAEKQMANEEKMKINRLIDNLFGRKRIDSEFPGFSTKSGRVGMRVRFAGLSMWLKKKPSFLEILLFKSKGLCCSPWLGTSNSAVNTPKNPGNKNMSFAVPRQGSGRLGLTRVSSTQVRGASFVDAFKVQKGKRILRNVTGAISPSKVTAIMGPSGSGKSSLITVLLGRADTYGVTEGSITVNTIPVEGSQCRTIRAQPFEGLASEPFLRFVTGLHILRNAMGYVPQDDIVRPDLTVRETLQFSAKLRLPKHSDIDGEGNPRSAKRKQHQIVDDTIRVLGLKAVEYELVGGVTHRGISGGQRKRVNIGMELVADPTLLLLDEPTSGLDASSSEDIMTALKRMAKQLHMTVVLVVHQPRYSIFESFDDLMLMGAGGALIYAGPRRYTKGYFESIGFQMPLHTNPADFVIDVATGHIDRKDHVTFSPDQLPKLWEEQGHSYRLGRVAKELSELAAGVEDERISDMLQAFTHGGQKALANSAEQRKRLLAKFQGREEDLFEQINEMVQASGLRLDRLSSPRRRGNRSTPKSSTNRKGGGELSRLANTSDRGSASHDTSDDGAKDNGPDRGEECVEQAPVRLSSSGGIGLFTSALKRVKSTSSNSTTENAKSSRAKDEANGEQDWVTILSPHEIKVLSNRFKEFDTDDSGRLDHDEFATLFQSMGVNCTKRMLDDFFNKLDEDHSGCISLDEFLHTMALMANDEVLDDGEDDIIRRRSRSRSRGASAAHQEGKLAAQHHTFTSSVINSLDFVNDKIEAAGEVAVSAILNKSSEPSSKAREDEIHHHALKTLSSRRLTSSALTRDDELKSLETYTDRHPPGHFRQVYIIAARSMIESRRRQSDHVVTGFMVWISACIVGVVHGRDSQYDRYPFLVIQLVTILGTLCSVAAHARFSRGRNVAMRELLCGMRCASYFVSHNITGFVPDVVILPLIYWLVYVGLSLPELPIAQCFGVCVLVAFVCSGIGYTCALLVKSGTNSLLAATIIPLIFGAINGVDPSISTFKSENSIMQYIVLLSYGRWAGEAMLIQGYNELEEHQKIVGSTVIREIGFGTSDEDFRFAVSMLVTLGFAFRFLAYIALRYELVMQDPADRTYRLLKDAARSFFCCPCRVCRRNKSEANLVEENTLKSLLKERRTSGGFTSPSGKNEEKETELSVVMPIV